MTDVAHTLGEFIAAWNAGERPRVETYLDRVAPADRDELADQIETFLLVAPEPEYSTDTWSQMTADPMVAAAASAAFEAEAWTSLLPRLRERAGVTWAQVAERLGVSNRAKAVEQLEAMEAGRLDPAMPSRTLLERLADVFGVSAETLDWRGSGYFGAPQAAAGVFRASAPASEHERRLEYLADALLSEDQEWDDVDELFLGGRD